MAGNEDKPRLPQRRGRMAPGDLPDGFEPIVPLFRRSKAPAEAGPASAPQPDAPPAPTVASPPRSLPRSATAPPPLAVPATALPEPSPVIAEPSPRDSSHSRLLGAGIALILVLIVVVAVMLLG